MAGLRQVSPFRGFGSVGAVLPHYAASTKRRCPRRSSTHFDSPVRLLQNLDEHRLPSRVLPHVTENPACRSVCPGRWDQIAVNPDCTSLKDCLSSLSLSTPSTHVNDLRLVSLSHLPLCFSAVHACDAAAAPLCTNGCSNNGWRR